MVGTCSSLPPTVEDELQECREVMERKQVREGTEGLEERRIELMRPWYGRIYGL